MSTNKKDEKIDWCFNILEDVSRTFSVPINMIDNPRSKEVCIGYLVCRISDTIEDEPDLTIDQKNKLFGLYEDIIKSKKNSDIENFVEKATEYKPDNPDEPKHWNLVLNTERLFDVYKDLDDDLQECIDNPALEMLNGMREYCNTYPKGLRLDTIKQLDNYCYYVAGTVGNMLTNITDYHNNIDDKDKLRYHAQKYGLLLQLVNIIKDVNEDYTDENNIYVPRELTDKYEIDQNKLVERGNTEVGEKLINELVEHAEKNIPNARKYLELLSNVENANMRSWSIPYLLAVATLRELNKKSSEVLTEGGVKIERDEVYSVIEKVQEADYEEIINIEKRINKKPLNEY